MLFTEINGNTLKLVQPKKKVHKGCANITEL